MDDFSVLQNCENFLPLYFIDSIYLCKCFQFQSLRERGLEQITSLHKMIADREVAQLQSSQIMVLTESQSESILFKKGKGHKRQYTTNNFHKRTLLATNS